MATVGLEDGGRPWKHNVGRSIVRLAVDGSMVARPHQMLEHELEQASKRALQECARVVPKVFEGTREKNLAGVSSKLDRGSAVARDFFSPNSYTLFLASAIRKFGIPIIGPEGNRLAVVIARPRSDGLWWLTVHAQSTQCRLISLQQPYSGPFLIVTFVRLLFELFGLVSSGKNGFTTSTKPTSSFPFLGMLIAGASLVGFSPRPSLGPTHHSGTSPRSLVKSRFVPTSHQYGTTTSGMFRKAGILDDTHAVNIRNLKGIYGADCEGRKEAASGGLWYRPRGNQ
jgi:hypothetical protein